jgi:hypothetical protein
MHLSSSLLLLSTLGLAAANNGKGNGNGKNKGLDFLARTAGLTRSCGTLASSARRPRPTARR